MIDGLKRYPKYKDSGVPWLGEVPAHWETKRLKYLFREVDNRSETGDEELLSVSHLTGVTPRREKNVTMFLAESNVGHKLCAPGDVVVNTMWAWMAALGVARQHGLVSPSYAVYRPLHDEVVAPEFMDRLLRTEALRAEYVRFSTGVNSSRMRLYPEQFLTIQIPYPSPDEQAAIVRFLTHVDHRIGRYIRATKKLIALLTEQKRAVIRRVVTRGVDPNVRLKPSGVDWLGDMPVNWELRKLRHCGEIIGGMTPSMDVREFWSGEIPWVTPKDMKRPLIGDTQMHVTPAALHKTSLRMIPAGAVLLVVRGMILARRVPVAATDREVTINQDMKAIVPDGEIDGVFLSSILASSQAAFTPLIDEAGHGTRRLPVERWREIVIPLPPKAEQARIRDAVQTTSESVDKILGAIQREIELMSELRTNLVVDVVTGKLDVREAAARPPKDGEADEFPEIGDTEEEIADAEMEAVEIEE